MFDFLKGGKATLKLVVDRPVQPYHFGENVHASVTVEGQKDIKIQQGRVTLVCHEEYEYRYESRTTDSDGHEHREERKSWQTDEKEVNRQVFMNETTIRGGSNQKFEFDLPIPPNAPSTCAGGRIIRVSWWVKATLDRKMASDVEEKQEIFVFSTPPGKRVGESDYGFSNEPGDAEMGLYLPGEEYVLGETVTGKLLIRPKKQFDVTDIRVELLRREFVPRDLGNECIEGPSVKLAGATKLDPNQPLEFPFALQIPGVLPPTCQTNNSSVKWTLKGVLSRRLRGDTRVEEEVLICNGR